MSSLFLVMLGGRHARANIEVHDVVIVVADCLEASFAQLRQAWFGEQKGLHIDAWAKINGIEFAGQSYRIQLTDKPPIVQQQKLWLINLGGYDAQQFGELHRYIFVVAPNAAAAKQYGKQQMASNWSKQHTDRVLDVDDCIAIDQVNGCYVQLVQDHFLENSWANTYITIA